MTLLSTRKTQQNSRNKGRTPAKKPPVNKKKPKQSRAKKILVTQEAPAKAKIESTVWDSGLQIVHKPIVVVPLHIQNVLRTIDSKLDSDVEFSIYCKATLKLPFVRLEEAFLLPAQTVTQSSIEYQEDPDGYNTVIHKHPGGLDSFSAVDAENINKNFDVSLLWLRSRGFVTGIVNWTVEAGIKLQLEAEIMVKEPPLGIDIDMSKINITPTKPIMHPRGRSLRTPTYGTAKPDESWYTDPWDPYSSKSRDEFSEYDQFWWSQLTRAEQLEYMKMDDGDSIDWGQDSMTPDERREYMRKDIYDGHDWERDCYPPGKGRRDTRGYD